MLSCLFSWLNIQTDDHPHRYNKDFFEIFHIFRSISDADFVFHWFCSLGVSVKRNHQTNLVTVVATQCCRLSQSSAVENSKSKYCLNWYSLHCWSFSIVSVKAWMTASFSKWNTFRLSNYQVINMTVQAHILNFCAIDVYAPRE